MAPVFLPCRIQLSPGGRNSEQHRVPSLVPGVYLDRYDKYNIPMTQLREQDDVGARQRRLKEQFGLAIMQVRPLAVQ